MTDSQIRNFCIKVTSHKYFESFIIFCIFTNSIILSLTWYNEPENLSNYLEIINYGFAAVFTLEAIIKLVAIKSAYFRDGWNVFDFIIVLGTYIGIIITETTRFTVGSQATLIRTFRIGRVLRLVKRAKSLRMIFNTFVITIPSLANVGGLLMLFLSIYSILGVFLFSTVKL
jgi:voltage-dependent calcium channel L type alpha-1D